MTTQRDGMGREEGGGFRMGNMCIPVADMLMYGRTLDFKSEANHAEQLRNFR